MAAADLRWPHGPLRGHHHDPRRPPRQPPNPPRRAGPPPPSRPSPRRDRDDARGLARKSAAAHRWLAQLRRRRAPDVLAVVRGTHATSDLQLRALPTHTPAIHRFLPPPIEEP